MTKQEKAERFVKSAPPLNRWERESINALFPTYLFRRFGTREVWTSCCHRHEILPFWNEQSVEERTVMTALHQREPQNRYQAAPKEDTPCPFCGRKAIVKELGRTGKRNNLCCYRRAVVLRWYRGALWARAYDCGKYYNDVNNLTGMPGCRLVGVYRFQPRLTEAAT